MNLLASAIDLAERAPPPDTVTASAVDFLAAHIPRKLAKNPSGSEDAFFSQMRRRFAGSLDAKKEWRWSGLDSLERLATAGLFSHAGCEEWSVGDDLMRRACNA